MEMSEIYVQLKDIRLLLANILSLVLLNFYFLYLWGHFLRSKDLEKRLELFQTQSSLQYRYYEQLEEKYKESRKAIQRYEKPSIRDPAPLPGGCPSGCRPVYG